MRTSTRQRPKRTQAAKDELGEGVLTPPLKRFFDAMASHFPGHVMQRLMRPDGSVRYTYVSPGLTALGLEPAEVLAAETSPQEWLHPDDASRWHGALVTSAATLGTLDEEVRVIGKDGRVRWVRSIGNPRRLRGGATVWDGIALDVTDKREALDALRLAKEQADTAEAQKASLLSKLRIEIEATLEDARSALAPLAVSKPSDHGGATQLSKAINAIDASLSLLRGTSSNANGDIDPRIATLTSRQSEVLQLMSQGASNKEIAERLTLSGGTVKLHVVAILKKLGVRSRSQATALLLRAQWRNANGLEPA